MNKIFSLLVLSASPVLALAAGQHAGGHGDHQSTTYGVPGKAAQVNRTVAVRATDNMRFEPATLTVRRGETIKFVVTNTGKLPHELVLGDAPSLKEHADMMRRHPGMAHDDPNAVKVAPGATGTLIWKFTEAGTVDFACLIPGHFEAGMKGSVQVGAR